MHVDDSDWLNGEPIRLSARDFAPTDLPRYPHGCPVCEDGEGKICSPECETVMRRRRIQGLYTACHAALNLARTYHEESGGADHRVHDVLEQVQTYRAAVRILRRAA